MGTQKRSLLAPSLPTHSGACWAVSGKLQACGAHLPLPHPAPVPPRLAPRLRVQHLISVLSRQLWGP